MIQSKAKTALSMVHMRSIEPAYLAEAQASQRETKAALSPVLRSARKLIQWINFSEEGRGSGSDERS